MERKPSSVLMIRLRPSLGETSHLCSSDDQFNPFRPNPVLGVVAGASRRARRSIGTAVLLQHHCAMHHCSKQSNAPRRSTAPRRFTARIAKPPLQRAKPLRLAEPIRLPLVGRGWRTRRAQRGPCYRAVTPANGRRGLTGRTVARGYTHLPIPKGEWSESSAQYCKKL